MNFKIFFNFGWSVFKVLLLLHQGEMAEWSIAAVLKTVEPRGSWGSNPYFSAKIIKAKHFAWLFLFSRTSKVCLCK